MYQTLTVKSDQVSIANELINELKKVDRSCSAMKQVEKEIEKSELSQIKSLIMDRHPVLWDV